MPGVYVRYEDESVDKLLKVLKKQVERAGTIYPIPLAGLVTNLTA